MKITMLPKEVSFYLNCFICVSSVWTQELMSVKWEVNKTQEKSHAVLLVSYALTSFSAAGSH